MAEAEAPRAPRAAPAPYPVAPDPAPAAASARPLGDADEAEPARADEGEAGRVAATADEAHAETPPAVTGQNIGREETAREEPARERGKPRRSPLARLGRVLGAVVAAAILLAVVGLGGLMLRLKSGPIDAPMLGAHIEREVKQALGPGLDLSLGPVRLVETAAGPAITIDGLRLRDADGATVMSAPRAEATLDPLAILRGEPPGKRLRVVGLELRLEGRPDGALVLSFGAEDARPIAFGGAASAQGPDQSGATPARAPVGAAFAAAAASLVDLAAAEQGPLGGLEGVSLAEARLRVVDAQGRPIADYRDVSVSFQRDRAAGSARLDLSAAGRAGPLRATARAAARGGERRLDVSVENLSSDEIALAAGFRERPVDFDMPVSGHAAITLTPDRHFAAMSGGFAVGAGRITLPDPKHEPIPLDGVEGGFRWRPDTHAIVVEPTRLRAGGTTLSIQGEMTPQDPASRTWALAFASTDNTLSAETAKEKAVALGALRLDGRYSLDTGVLSIDRLELSGADVAMTASAVLDGGPSGPAAKLTLKAQRMQARSFLRFWPTLVAPEARAWFIESLRSGTLEEGDLALDLDRATLLSPPRSPVPENAVALSFRVSDATLDYLPGAPPLTAVVGKGRVGGRSADFVASSAEVRVGDRRLTLSDARFEAPDFVPDPVAAKVTARVQGTLEAVMDYLSRPAFKTIVKLPAQAHGAHGQIDARLTLALELGKGAGPPRARVEAQARGVAIDRFFGDEKLTDATLAIVSDDGGLRVKGEGKALGAPAQVDLRASGGAGDALVTFAFDDAARARRGFAVSGLTGPVSARVAAPLADLGHSAKAHVDLDFSAATFRDVAGVVNKPAGRPAKASFTFAAGDKGASLDNLVFDGAGVSARGAANFSAEGDLRGFKLTHLRLSPGDDLRLEGQRSGDRLSLTARGAALDARPFLKAAAGVGESKGALDLDLETVLLTGHNKQAIGDAKLRLSRVGDRVRRFDLTGRFGRDPLRVRLAEDGESLRFDTEDAGSAFAFLDLYKRMEGGRMVGVARIKGSRVDADFEVRRFVLRDEPAVRGLVAESAAVRHDPALATRIDVALVPFERLEARVARSPEQLTIRDAVLSGPNVGLTVEGAIDTRDRLALTGTFVPAYAINNFFAKLPLLGPLLGGSSNEGLFAVTFRIGGTMSKPKVQVNPLSALAPGVFRRMFSFDGSQKAAPPPDRAAR